MGLLETPEPIPVVESSSLPDIWIDGIAGIEELSGGCYRFILCRYRKDQNGSTYCEPVASIVCHKQVAHDSAKQVLFAIAGFLKAMVINARRLC